MREIWRPEIRMSSKVFHYRRRGGSWVGREIEISREYLIGGENERLISLDVKWTSNDRREKDIRSGECRNQNVIIEIKHLLSILREMFPEYNISFNESIDMPQSPTPEHPIEE